MALGTVLLFLAVATSSGAVLTSFLSLRNDDEQYRKLSRFLNLLTYFMTSFAMLVLVLAFVTDDFSVQTVYDHSSSSLGTLYKISAMWAGRGGSFLLWAWVVSFALIIEEAIFNQDLIKTAREEDTKKGKRRRARMPYRSEGGPALLRPGRTTYLNWMRITGLVVLLTLMAVVIHYDVFAHTTEERIKVDGDGNAIYDGHGDPVIEDVEVDPPEGRGLDPSLETPLMVLHPPVTFLAYGMSVIPFSAAIAHLLTGYRGWRRHSVRWARPAWFFFTLGIGLGALWAYTELSFGGYWAWDPVEVVNLLPWFAATALLHMHLRPRKEFGHAAPMVAVLLMIMTFFATFTTRGGGLWLSSAHDYVASGQFSEGAGERLKEILAGNTDIAIIFSAMVVIYFMSCGLLAMRYFMDNLYGDFRRGRRDLTTGFPFFYLVFMVFLSGYAVLDIHGLTSIALGIADIFPGHAGVMLVLVAVFLPMVAWIYSTLGDEDEEVEVTLEKLVDDKGLMQLAVLFLIFTLFITFITLLAGMNGIRVDDFHEKMLFIVPLLLIVLTICLIWRMTGRRTATILGAVAAFGSIVGVIGCVVGMNSMSDCLVGVLMPPAIVGLGAAMIKVSETVSGMSFRTGEHDKEHHMGGTEGKKWDEQRRASRKHVRSGVRPGKRDKFEGENLAAVLVFLAGLLGLLMWGASPVRVILVFPMETNGFMLSAGFLLSLTAMALAPVVAARENFALAVLAGLTAVLSAGFMVGSVLGAFALYLVAANRMYYRDAKRLKLSYASYREKDDFVLFSRIFFRKVLGDLLAMAPVTKKTGGHLIHLGLVLLIIGYTVNTAYESKRNIPSAQEGSSMGIELEDFELEIVNITMTQVVFGRSTFYRHADGSLEETRLHELYVTMTVDILYKDGTNNRRMIAGGVEINYFECWYNITGENGTTVRSIQTTTGGTYNANLGFRDIFIIYHPRISNKTLEPTGRVELELRYLPFMNVLWGGMWLMVAGSFLTILAMTAINRMDEKKRDEKKRDEKKRDENKRDEKKRDENKRDEKKRDEKKRD